MSLNEFGLINEYFKRSRRDLDNVLVGIGDDAAVLRATANQDLVVSIDTLITGVHFPENTSAYDIGWKALAVNLSDMAAMGAQPAWFTLALTLPEPSRPWLEAFSHGLFSLADQYNLSLVGGDTTRGPLSVTIQIAGHVEKNRALLRSGAQAGDDIYVSGTLGDAALALAMIQSDSLSEDIAAELLARLNRPEPRVKLGAVLVNIAHCAIDLSDGLLADLQHMLETVSLGAELDTEALPQSSSFAAVAMENKQQLQLNGGDDYELCFCASPDKCNEIALLATEYDIPLTKIGVVTTSQSIFDMHGTELNKENTGYQHFTAN